MVLIVHAAAMVVMAAGRSVPRKAARMVRMDLSVQAGTAAPPDERAILAPMKAVAAVVAGVRWAMAAPVVPAQMISILQRQGSQVALVRAVVEEVRPEVITDLALPAVQVDQVK